MAPGSSPVFTPCGAAGGNPQGSSILSCWSHSSIFPKSPFQQLTPTPHSPLFPLQAAPREVQADQGRTVATPMAVALPTDPTQKILSSMTLLLLNGPLGAPRWLVGGRFVPHCLYWIYSMSPLILEVFLGWSRVPRRPLYV